MINFWTVFSFYLHSRQTGKPELTLFMANIKRDNDQYQKIVDYIKEVNPDVFILEEVTPASMNAINTLSKAYPYRIDEVRDDYFGIILFSKFPLQNARIEKLGIAGLPTVVADVQMKEKFITLIGTHPVPPFHKRATEQRNNQLDTIAKFINKQSSPVILTGDFNSTPFSYPYEKLVRDTSLSNCANGFGYQPTWNYAPFVPPFGLSIDHCLRSEEIGVTESYVGKDIGSDHKPIINRVLIHN